MSITIPRLALADGALFEDVEVAPYHLRPFDHYGTWRLEFSVDRKIATAKTRPSQFPGDPNTDYVEIEWRPLPGCKFNIAYDPNGSPHAQAYAAIQADPRFGGAAQ